MSIKAGGIGGMKSMGMSSLNSSSNASNRSQSVTVSPKSRISLTGLLFEENKDNLIKEANSDEEDESSSNESSSR